MYYLRLMALLLLTIGVVLVGLRFDRDSQSDTERINALPSAAQTQVWQTLPALYLGGHLADEIGSLIPGKPLESFITDEMIENIVVCLGQELFADRGIISETSYCVRHEGYAMLWGPDYYMGTEWWPTATAAPDFTDERLLADGANPEMWDLRQTLMAYARDTLSDGDVLTFIYERHRARFVEEVLKSPELALRISLAIGETITVLNGEMNAQKLEGLAKRRLLADELAEIPWNDKRRNEAREARSNGMDNNTYVLTFPNEAAREVLWRDIEQMERTFDLNNEAEIYVYDWKQRRLRDGGEALVATYVTMLQDLKGRLTSGISSV